MEKIALGKQGFEVSRIGFGCMGLTTAYNKKIPDNDIMNLLEKTANLGITLWDTANIYVYMDAMRLLRFSSPVVCQEEIIGKALEKVGRDRVSIATKTGVSMSLFPRLKLAPNGAPSFIRDQCNNSLRRLGVQTLDLFYLHRIDPNVPIEMTMSEMKKLVQEGKVKYVGLSECSASTIRRAHKIHPLTAVQMEWSLWCRGIEKEIVPTCAELGIGIVAYSPLGKGFLTDSYKANDIPKGDYRRTLPRLQGDALKRNADMVEKLQKIADEKGVSTAQLALAWVEGQQKLLNGAGVVAIPGTTKEKNLISNVESLKVELSSEDMRRMEEAVPWEQVDGGRYGEGGSSSTWEVEKNRALTDAEATELGLN